MRALRAPRRKEGTARDGERGILSVFTKGGAREKRPPRGPPYEKECLEILQLHFNRAAEILHSFEGFVLLVHAGSKPEFTETYGALEMPYSCVFSWVSHFVKSGTFRGKIEGLLPAPGNE